MDEEEEREHLETIDTTPVDALPTVEIKRDAVPVIAEESIGEEPVIEEPIIREPLREDVVEEADMVEPTLVEPAVVEAAMKNGVDSTLIPVATNIEKGMKSVDPVGETINEEDVDTLAALIKEEDKNVNTPKTPPESEGISDNSWASLDQDALFAMGPVTNEDIRRLVEEQSRLIDMYMANGANRCKRQEDEMRHQIRLVDYLTREIAETTPIPMMKLEDMYIVRLRARLEGREKSLRTRSPWSDGTYVREEIDWSGVPTLRELVQEQVEKSKVKDAEVEKEGTELPTKLETIAEEAEEVVEVVEVAAPIIRMTPEQLWEYRLLQWTDEVEARRAQTSI